MYVKTFVFRYEFNQRRSTQQIYEHELEVLIDQD